MAIVGIVLALVIALVIGLIFGFIHGCKFTLWKVARGEVKKVTLNKQ